MQIEVTFSNLSEDVWDFISTLSPQARKHEVEENAFLSDRDIFYFDPQKKNILVLPTDLNQDFLAYYQDLFQNNEVEIWVPKKHTGQICRDLQDDLVLWPRLITLAKKNQIEFKSYSASKQFYSLISDLHKKGANILLPESPAIEHSWTVDFFGSKSGARQLVTKLQLSAQPNKRWIADGLICSDRKNAAEIAANKYVANGSVVIKTNKGHAGMGVNIIHKGEIPEGYENCLSFFLNMFKQEKYWQEFPIIVEECLDIENSIGGGNPNAEFFVTKTGEVQLLYNCGMRVSKDGVFKGIEIGPGTLPASVVKKVSLFGQKMGEAYAENAYCGYFDIDCIATKDKEILVAESNVRRTGGTHVYHIARQLLGKDFEQNFTVLSNNTYPLPPQQKLSFTKIQKMLETLLFNRAKQEGVVLVAANILKQNKLSYMVIGKSRKSALKIEEEMQGLIVKISG